MAYGLDVTDLIYTTDTRYDLGTLADYELDLDVAGEKNFSLEVGSSADFTHRVYKTRNGKTVDGYSQLDLLIPMGGYWYINGTEFGGIIDKFQTDNANYSIKYLGRSWRGILNSKIVIAENSTSVDFEGNITDVVNELLDLADISDLFVCESADVDPTVETEVGPLSVYHGSTLYDVISAIARSIFFSYNFVYSNYDQKVHIIPILSRDYTDVMTYSTDNTIKFSVGRDYTFTNHYILTAVDDETEECWTIHIFLDEYKIIQAYCTVDSDKVIRDSEYILDQSAKVLNGAKEIAEYLEYSNSPVANYVLLEEQPKDWEENYLSYFRHENQIEDETLEVIGEKWNPVETVETPVYNLLSSEPDDWESNYESYYYRSWNSDISDFDEIKAYINPNAATFFQNDWLTDGTDVLVPEEGVVYTIQTPGDYYHSAFEWNLVNYISSDKTFESPHWEYNAVSSQSSTEPYEQVTIQPEDWDMTYSNFYYKVNDELVQYATIQSPDIYQLVEEQPEDWAESYTNYYRYITDYNPEQGMVLPYYIQYGSTGSENLYYPVTKKPANWDTDYGSYYFYREWFDGINNVHTYESYSGIETTDHKKCSSKPSDWNTSYSNYYYKVEAGLPEPQYIQYGSAGEESEYALVKKKPDTQYWRDHISDYYYKRTRKLKINGKATPVIDYVAYSTKGDKSTYLQVVAKPSDWDINYSQYYFKKGSDYQTYSGKKGKGYNKLTKEPKDWNKQYKNYYEKKSSTKADKNSKEYKDGKGKEKYVKVSGKKAPKFKANKYYSKYNKEVAPAFNKNNCYIVDKTTSKVPAYVQGEVYYKKSTIDKAPSYKPNNTYMISQVDTAPTYQAGNTYIQIDSVEHDPPAFEVGNTYIVYTEDLIPEFQYDNSYLPVTEKYGPKFKPNQYYRMEMQYGPPEFMENTFYKEELDHYASMIEELKNQLAELASNDTQQITLDDYDLNIGDLVGGKDDITGLEITQEVTNMVVKINSGIVNIDYTIGDVDISEEEYEEPEEEESGGEEE